MVLRKLGAEPVYLIRVGVTSFLYGMMFVALGVYYVNTIHLNPLQLVLVGTTVESTIFLFEVPTGVVADMRSRRLSVILGDLTIGCAYVVQASIASFGGILLSQVIWGIGETFTSGAFDAWLADEVGESRAGKVYLRAAQVGLVCGMTGTVTGALLGSLEIRLPILIGGVLFIAHSLFLRLFMPEAGFTPSPRGESQHVFGHFRHTLSEGVRVVRGRPVLITILLIGIVYGAFTEGFDRLNEAHFLNNVGFPNADLQPVAWFAILSIVGGLIGLVGAEFARRRIATDDHRQVARALFLISILLSLGVMGFGLATTFGIAAAAALGVSLLRTLRGPLTTAWLNQNVDSQVRATVISMSNQSDALGQLAVGPVIGAIGAAFGLRTALVIAGVLLTPALYLYARTLRRPFAPSEDVVVPPGQGTADLP
jgi:DHA3 family tetracycline resistance protein-like MFS transporter